jgi:hypothetical protein
MGNQLTEVRAGLRGRKDVVALRNQQEPRKVTTTMAEGNSYLSLVRVGAMEERS